MQQFHAPIELAVPNPPAEEEASEEEDDQHLCLSESLLSVMDMDDPQPLVASQVSVEVAVASVGAEQPRGEVSGGVAGISFISKDTSSLPVGAFPDFAVLNETRAPAPEASKEVPTSSLPTQSVDIGVKSKHILLNALKVKPPGQTGSEGQVAKAPSTTTTSSVPPANSSKDKQSQSVKGPSATAPKQSSSSVLESHSTKKKNSDSQKERAETQDTPPAGEKLANSSKLATAPSGDDDWENASLTISRSQHSTPQQSRSKSLEEPDMTTVAVLVDKMNSVEQSLQNLSQSKMGELKAGVVRDVLRGMDKQITAPLGRLVEEQSQQAAARILSSEQWREEVSCVRHFGSCFNLFASAFFPDIC